MLKKILLYVSTRTRIAQYYFMYLKCVGIDCDKTDKTRPMPADKTTKITRTTTTTMNVYVQRPRTVKSTGQSLFFPLSIVCRMCVCLCKSRPL